MKKTMMVNTLRLRRLERRVRVVEDTVSDVERRVTRLERNGRR